MYGCGWWWLEKKRIKRGVSESKEGINRSGSQERIKREGQQV